MTSSSCVTFLLFVHPVERHGCTHVSGNSRDGSGPVLLEPIEDVATTRIVGRDPLGGAGLPPVQVLAAARLLHPGAVERQVLARTQEGAQFDELARVECLDQVGGLECRTEPAPRDELGVRRDGRGRVELQQRQLPDDVEQVDRTGVVEQLRPHGDPPGIGSRELMHDHDARLIRRRPGRCDSIARPAMITDIRMPDWGG